MQKNYPQLWKIFQLSFLMKFKFLPLSSVNMAELRHTSCKPFLALNTQSHQRRLTVIHTQFFCAVFWQLRDIATASKIITINEQFSCRSMNRAFCWDLAIDESQSSIVLAIHWVVIYCQFFAVWFMALLAIEREFDSDIGFLV